MGKNKNKKINTNNPSSNNTSPELIENNTSASSGKSTLSQRLIERTAALKKESDPALRKEIERDLVKIRASGERYTFNKKSFIPDSGGQWHTSVGKGFASELTDEEKTFVRVTNENKNPMTYHEELKAAGFETLPQEHPIVKKIISERSQYDSYGEIRNVFIDEDVGRSLDPTMKISPESFKSNSVFVRGNEGIYRLPSFGIKGNILPGNGFNVSDADGDITPWRRAIAPQTYDLEGNLLSFGAVTHDDRQLNIDRADYPEKLSSPVTQPMTGSAYQEHYLAHTTNPTPETTAVLDSPEYIKFMEHTSPRDREELRERATLLAKHKASLVATPAQQSSQATTVAPTESEPLDPSNNLGHRQLLENSLKEEGFEYLPPEPESTQATGRSYSDPIKQESDMPEESEHPLLDHIAAEEEDYRKHIEDLKKRQDEEDLQGGAGGTPPSGGSGGGAGGTPPSGGSGGGAGSRKRSDTQVPGLDDVDFEEFEKEAELRKKAASVKAASEREIDESEYSGRRELKTSNRLKRGVKALGKGSLDIVAGGLVGALIGGAAGFAEYDKEEDKDPYTAPFRTIGKIASTLEGAAKGAIKGSLTGALLSSTQGIAGMFVDDYEGMSMTGAFVRGFRSVSGKTAAKEGIGGTAGQVREGMEEIPFVAHVFGKDAEKTVRRQVKRADILEASGEVEKANEMRKAIEASRSKMLSPSSRQGLETSSGAAMAIRDTISAAAYGAGALTALPFATLGAVRNLHKEHIADKMETPIKPFFHAGKQEGMFGRVFNPRDIGTGKYSTPHAAIGGALGLSYSIAGSAFAAGTAVSMMSTPFSAAFESSGLGGNANHPYNVIRGQDLGATARAQMEADASNKVRMTRPNMIGLSDIDEAYFTNQSFRQSRGRHTPGKYNDDGNLVFALSALRRG